ncbi:hypothetical protein RXV95_04080 [Novosphingobium sp. ZN18A2]|uniref:hypothetical protein n=1 Tax=Novosphingobium sp. ZN18A2 TaxID=3079861 RepID=UPI0030CF1D04
MTETRTDRRGVIGAGALVAGVAGAGVLASAPARAEDAGGWKAAQEPQDAWMDIPGTRHRMVYDSNSPQGFAEALFYASNYYFANKAGYGLSPDTLGVILIARHMGTPFAYTDAIWAKYGAAFAKVAGLEGKEAELAKTVNPLLVPGRVAMSGPAGDASVATLAKTGARFAVCGLATTFIAGMLAKETGGSAKDIDAELSAGLVPGATMVAAGILAVERAQSHGYAFAYVG